MSAREAMRGVFLTTGSGARHLRMSTATSRIGYAASVPHSCIQEGNRCGTVHNPITPPELGASDQRIAGLSPDLAKYTDPSGIGPIHRPKGLENKGAAIVVGALCSRRHCPFVCGDFVGELPPGSIHPNRALDIC